MTMIMLLLLLIKLKFSGLNKPVFFKAVASYHARCDAAAFLYLTGVTTSQSNAECIIHNYKLCESGVVYIHILFIMSISRREYISIENKNRYNQFPEGINKVNVNVLRTINRHICLFYGYISPTDYFFN